MSDTKYTILLPTYNERENLPVMIWLINETMTKHDYNFEVIIIGKPKSALQFFDPKFYRKIDPKFYFKKLTQNFTLKN